jgi:site-specific DNA-methyltransferase (adenine-specific)
MSTSASRARTKAFSRAEIKKASEARKKAFELGWKVLSDVDVREPRRARGQRYDGGQMPSSPKSLAKLPLDQILQGDSVEKLNALPEAWVDLCFADPPFNIGYLYHGYDDAKDVQEYLDFSEKWMAAVQRALKPGGSFYLAIGDEFAADLAVIARRKLGLHLRNWIVWHYTFGQQTRKMFAKSHTHILYFTKEKPNAGMTNLTFNADAIRVKSARQTIYEDARANPKGKLPDDTWFLRPQEANYLEPGYREFAQSWGNDADAEVPAFFDPTTSVWNVSRVCGTFKEREGWHGCQMPMGVLDRIIKASSNPGDVVLDPFNGSGTTAVSAALLNRRYVGIDQSAEYVKFAQSRLEHAKENARKDDATDKVFDIRRASRVKTATDAFGRPRVERKKQSRRAKNPAA